MQGLAETGKMTAGCRETEGNRLAEIRGDAGRPLHAWCGETEETRGNHTAGCVETETGLRRDSGKMDGDVRDWGRRNRCLAYIICLSANHSGAVPTTSNSHITIL